MEQPPLIVFRAIEPLTKSVQAELDLGLVHLSAEDRAFRFTRDFRTGETLIWGRDELHLNGIAEYIPRCQLDRKADPDYGSAYPSCDGLAAARHAP
jgi:translation elongation factor EF-G